MAYPARLVMRRNRFPRPTKPTFRIGLTEGAAESGHPLENVKI